MVFVSTSSTWEKDVFKALDRLKSIGITDVELGSIHNKVSDLNKVIAWKNDNDARFTVHAFFPPSEYPYMLNFGSVEEKIRKKCISFSKESLDFCRKADALLYTIHLGYDSEVDPTAKSYSDTFASDDEVFNNTKESVIELADYAAQYGLRIGVENHSSYDRKRLFSRPEEVLSLLKAINKKNVGLLCDLGHLKIAANKLEFDLKDAVHQMKDHIFQFHIHDNQGVKDEHLPLQDNGYIDCIPKELSKKAVFVIEGMFGKWSDQDILDTKKIIEEKIGTGL